MKKKLKNFTIVVLIFISISAVFFAMFFSNLGYMLGIFPENVRLDIELAEQWYENAFAEIEKLDETATTVEIDGYTHPIDLIFNDYEIHFKEQVRRMNIAQVQFTAGSIGIFLLSSFFLFLICTWKYRCPKCKKQFALVRGAPINVGFASATFDADHATISVDKWGNNKATVEKKNITHKRSVHKVPYTCKYCGASIHKEVHGS
jgi:DNA-directed RNA polymerase subunit RPC12/RpoP